MTAMERTASGLSIERLAGWVEWGLTVLARIARALAPLFLRAGLALPFYYSGLTKWAGFLSLSPSAPFLFEKMFKVHILGGVYPLPFPATLAWLAAAMEIVLPVLLIFGLFTRLSAVLLLGMTAVIQLVVPEGWLNFHLPWAAMALALIAMGAGPISLDAVLRRSFPRPSPA